MSKIKGLVTYPSSEETAEPVIDSDVYSLHDSELNNLALEVDSELEGVQPALNLGDSTVDRCAQLENFVVQLKQTVRNLRSQITALEAKSPKEVARIMGNVERVIRNMEKVPAYNYATSTFDIEFFIQETSVDLKKQVAKFLLDYFGSDPMYQVDLWKKLVNNDPGILTLLYGD